MRLLSHLLRSFVKRGRLRVIDASGRLHVFGEGGDGPTVAIRLHRPALELGLFFNPELRAGEAYMDGTLTLEEGTSLYSLIELFWINRARMDDFPTQRWLQRYWQAVRHLQQHNSVDRAKQHARYHYDLPTDLYRLFLDEGLNYSCAYFRSPEDSLEEAQLAKHRHIIAKLDVRPGMSVLEIGGGWGALAISLARAGARVVSLNVSPEQVAIARERAAEAGVAGRVDFVLKDYREFGGTFDRVVSVGMMEHVGVGYLRAFFESVGRFLVPDGFALLHSIGRTDPPGTTAPFIRKYIFPGGYVPALSETFAAVERTGLWCADAEILRLHYHHTIRHWRRRFEARREEAKALMGERFCRMWEFYLIGVELGFLHGPHMVFQLLVSHGRDAVPIVRDYMVDGERLLAAGARHA